jgi:putative transposase
MLTKLVQSYFWIELRRISISTGFKDFESAQRTLAGIEIINIIRKNQIKESKSTTFKTFCSLAA